MSAPTNPKTDAILSRLDRMKPLQKGWLSRCPAHEDGNPSLKIDEGRDWINLHCYAGCSYDSIREALGATWDDLKLKDDDEWTPEIRRRRPFDRRGAALEAAMCAEALQADLPLLEKLRLERGWAAPALRLLQVGSTGKPRHPLTLPVWDEKGQLHDVLRYDPFVRQGAKVLGGKGKSRYPWPAPESLTPNGRPLFLVEGEGTAISLFSIGLNAVGLPGSVSRGTGDPYRPGSFTGGGWHRTWVRRFKGHRIICMPDNDEAGKALIHAASYDLSDAGINTAILDLRANAKGFDVGDLLKPANTLAKRRDARKLLLDAAHAAKHEPLRLDARIDLLREWYARERVTLS